MATVYEKFMELCEYKPEEMARELPRVKEAFKRLQLTEADVRTGKERAIKHYQCDLRGMRMILGYVVRTVVDMILSKDEGKMRLWVEMPLSMFASMYGAVLFHRDDVVISCPSVYIELLMGAIFNKLDSLIKYAEDRCLPAGASHCGCTQGRYGIKVSGLVPPGDLYLSCGVYCDESPKVDEAIQRETGENVFYVSRPQDEYLTEPPGSGKHLEYLVAGLEQFRQELSRVVGFEVTDELLKKSLHGYLLVQTEVRKVEELVANADPQVLRMSAMGFAWYTYLFTPGTVNNEYRMEALRVLQEELNGMIARGEGVVPKGAPRVMYCPLCPVVTSGIGDILEAAGINMCCYEAYGAEMIKTSELSAMLESAPAMVIYALMWLLIPEIMTIPRVDSILAGVKKANLDGILLLAYHSCRIVGSDMFMVKHALREKLGKDFPIGLMEYDIFDPKYYNPQQLATRLESFAEMMKVCRRQK